MTIEEQILKALPYTRPFLFVDGIREINQEEVIGYYRFREDEYFYDGHFKGNPVTPGVILVECMAQIGLVCLGIYLLGTDDEANRPISVAFTSSDVDFYKSVPPGDEVDVRSTKIYWRLGKLKCEVKMFDKEESVICAGTLSGMIK